MSDIVNIPIAKIRLDGNTQVRAVESDAAVERYIEAMRLKAALPPPDLFFDGTDYWVGDGWHRIKAHRKLGLDTVSARVRQGSRWDALRFACRSNREHGLPLTNADKRKIVEIYFSIPGNENLSNHSVAKALQVSTPFVKSVRDEIGVKSSPSAHVGRGSKNLNDLNSTPTESVENLNGLNTRARSGMVDVSLSADEPERFAVELFEHFEAAYLKRCMKLVDDLVGKI